VLDLHSNYLSTLPNFLIFFAIALAFLGLFTAVYVWVTPHKEFALIRAGNTAAAISLSGAVIGFVIPLASVIANSLNVIDTLIWGAVALVVQVLVFVVARLVAPRLPKAIEAGEIAPAWTLAAFAIAVGILNAACMTY
jgi:putative membrane protein